MSGLAGETELKLWLRACDVQAFKALPRLQRARAQRQILRTIYFDSPDFRLAQAGAALRVRKTGRGWVQTLKAGGSGSGGLSSRLELEAPVGGPRPDFSRLPAAVLDTIVPKPWRAGLSAVYETRFARTSWNLRLPGGSRVEVALDIGKVIAGDRSEAICEVELELKSGTVDALHTLAATLAQGVLLIPCDISKAERGAALATGRARGPAAARMPPVQNAMPIRMACAAILRACLDQLQKNLAGLLASPDPEYLHQARVAVRRMRSASGLFRKSCPPPAEAAAHLAELGRALGVARDWDVFMLEALPALRGALTPAQMTRISSRARREHERARKSALALVASPQTGMDILALHRWLDNLESGAGRKTLERLAGKKLARLHRAVLAAARGFAQQSPQQRHALRIRVKRLRYALDYLSGLFEPAPGFVAGFRALQDDLGAMNDVNTALRFLALLNQDGGMDALAIRAGRKLDEKLAQLGVETGDRLQVFTRLPPPWQRKQQ